MSFTRSTQVINYRGLAGRRRYGGWWKKFPRPQWQDIKKILKSVPKALKDKILSTAAQKGNQAVQVLSDTVRKNAGSAAGDLVGTLGGAAVNKVQKTIEKQVGNRGKKRPAPAAIAVPAKKPKPKAGRPTRRRRGRFAPANNRLARDIFGTYSKVRY
jgi:hypothetical protein